MKNISEALGLELPIIQAPLEFYESHQLVSKVSENGCLGVYSANYKSLEQIKSEVKNIQSATDKPFAVMLSVTEEDMDSNSDGFTKFRVNLETVYSDLNLSLQSDYFELPTFKEVLSVVLEAKPKSIIFQNGLPADERLQEISELGIYTFAVASNTLEAIAIASAKIDAVILQGVESSGTHSRFSNDLNIESYPVNTLLHHAVDNIEKPVVVWGDYHYSSNIVGALVNGADAVVVDTPFWSSSDSDLPAAYREGLKKTNEMTTVVSDVWNGFPARTIKNKLTELFNKTEKSLSSKKRQSLMLPIINAGIETNNSDYMPMWAGFRVTNSDSSVSELIKQYEEELNQIIES